MARMTEIKINNINNFFEKLWKIKTNPTKSTIITLGKNIKANIRIEEKVIRYKENGKMLGLKIGSHKYFGHQRNKLK